MQVQTADECYERFLQKLDAYAAKHSLTHDEALMQLSEGAEGTWLAQQPKQAGEVLLFRRK